MAVVAGYFLAWETGKGSVPATLGGIAVGLFGLRRDHLRSKPVRSATTDELYRANSNFGLLQVLQNKEANKRYYLNDFLVQNIYDPQQKQSLALFTYALHQLARAYTLGSIVPSALEWASGSFRCNSLGKAFAWTSLKSIRGLSRWRPTTSIAIPANST